MPKKHKIVCTCPDATGFPHCTAPDCKRITPLRERLGKLSFDGLVRTLEHAVPGAALMPGTMLRRIWLDGDLAASYKLEPPADEPAWPAVKVKAWCLTLGPLGQTPEITFYGWKLMDVFVKAWEELVKS